MLYTPLRQTLPLALLAALPAACSAPAPPQDTGGNGGSNTSSIVSTGAGMGGMGSGGAGQGTTTGSGTGAGSTVGTGGGLPMLPCDPGFSFDSNPITSPIVTVTYTNSVPYAYVDMEVKGPGAPASYWGGVVGNGPYTWTYTVDGY